MVKFPLAALVAIVCLALAGLATPIALGAAEKGTLRIQFMGKSFQELDVSRVQAGLKGVDRRWTTPKKTPDQDIVAEAPAGTRMLTLFVEGRFSFEVDVGPVTIKPSKETAKQINLSHYMGAIRFEAADHSLFNKALVWLYPDRDKWHFAFGKDHIPEDGVVNYVPGARMWMVVTDGGKTPLAAQWIRVFPKRQITVQLKKLHQDIKLPVQVRLRTDSVKESDLSFQLLGSRSQDFKQSTASGFYTEVQPGFYNIRVKNKDMEHSSVDFFVMDAPVEMLLVVDGPEKVRFCSSQAMKRAKHLFNKGERLTKASRLEDAILFYDRADTCLINDRAQRKATELGEQLAARAEKAKRYRGNGFLYYSSLKEERCEEAPDMYPPKQGGVCLFNQFIVSNPKAGAIEWLTAVESPEAGRVAVKYIQSIPVRDPEAFRLAPGFFDKRGLLERMKGHVASIENIALQKEDEMFRSSQQEAPVDIIAGDPMQKARETAFSWLEIASAWASHLDQAKQEAIRRRASQRGGALKQGITPQALGAAIEYYEFAHDQQGVESAKQRASGLGHQHLKQGETELAGRFFSIAGDESGQRLAEEARETESQREEERVEKRKKKFMRETEDLEKEFGF